ncbi:uncharacterized protein CEXT_760061 [Caerostris extrusa]|uniref:RNase H type-1 domain-containing protein n=1 Tax=Caerostris extrusa TaxID=172846 RepID=A0AAV4NS13_CAEEX|nr:uncharacterized protein CEXT_760061 [Caerostris extrusa]
MVQEPYTTNNQIPGIPTGWKQITSKTNRAAIIIRTTAIPPTQVSIAEDSVTISIPLADKDILVTSLYSTPSEDISTQLNEYEKAVHKESQQIICGDFNAQSEKGCPQGSCLGPFLWSIIANKVLQTKWDEEVDLQAFADDFIFIITSNNRRDLEKKATKALQQFSKWAIKKNCQSHKKNTSPNTREKGNIKRVPILKYEGWQVKCNYTIIGAANSEWTLPLHLTVKKEVIMTNVTRLGRNDKFGRTHFNTKDYDTQVSQWLEPPWSKPSTTIKNILNSSNIIIYTDGSKIDHQVGSAFVVYEKDKEIYNWQGKLNTKNSVYQAELLAILKALQWAKNKDFSQISIKTDSMSSLQANKKFLNKNNLVQKIRNEIQEIRPKLLKIEWIKAHSGIVGNERADYLAKDATINPNTLSESLPTPKSFIKHQLKQLFIQQWQEEWNTANTGRRTHNFIPKVSHNMSTNLLITYFVTGHGPFPTYLNSFCITDNDTCLCGEPGSPDHYLFSCPLTDLNHEEERSPASCNEWAIKAAKCKKIKEK